MDIRRELIVGNLLGDGHLCQNWSGTNFRLKISQAKKQEDYVFWKYDILKDFVLTGPKLHTSTNSVRFATISHPELTNFHNIFYQGRKKIIPKNIADLLSPLVVAIWFMDDGNVKIEWKNVGGYHLNTQSFSTDENILLIEAMKNRYGIVPTMQRNHNKFRLYIGSKYRNKFREIIDQYILPALKYKLG